MTVTSAEGREFGDVGGRAETMLVEAFVEALGVHSLCEARLHHVRLCLGQRPRRRDGKIGERRGLGSLVGVFGARVGAVYLLANQWKINGEYKTQLNFEITSALKQLHLRVYLELSGQIYIFP